MDAIGLLKLLTYLSGLIFVIAFAAKIIRYFSMPMHVRWELYPVPHEGKPYGGSFFEEVDHWKKERHKDHVAQYTFMVPEILFIRALYEDNRPLWYWSFPFHMGLYLCIGGLVFLAIGAILEAGGLAAFSFFPRIAGPGSDADLRGYRLRPGNRRGRRIDNQESQRSHAKGFYGRH